MPRKSEKVHLVKEMTDFGLKMWCGRYIYRDPPKLQFTKDIDLVTCTPCLANVRRTGR